MVEKKKKQEPEHVLHTAQSLSKCSIHLNLLLLHGAMFACANYTQPTACQGVIALCIYNTHTGGPRKNTQTHTCQTINFAFVMAHTHTFI